MHEKSNPDLFREIGVGFAAMKSLLPHLKIKKEFMEYSDNALMRAEDAVNVLANRLQAKEELTKG